MLGQSVSADREGATGVFGLLTLMISCKENFDNGNMGFYRYTTLSF